MTVVDPTVIAALERAVAEDPENPALRLHLAGLQVLSGDARRALGHAQRALAAAPADALALATARDAARALGDGLRAERYGRLLRALDVWTPAGGPTLLPPRRDRFAAPASDGGRPGLPARSRVTLDDVGGLDDVKAQLEAVYLAPLRTPALRNPIPPAQGGLLLYGPPGCGATLLARAIAGELGARFAGAGRDGLAAAFDRARRRAPCVLCLQDADLLGPSGNLIAELDGERGDNLGVFVVACTSAPWDVDERLRAGGRLDRAVLVLPPDEGARAAILRAALARRPADPIDVERLARASAGCSAADLVGAVETAAESALLAAARAGALLRITEHDVGEALARTAPSTRAWFALAHEHARGANDDGRYDDVLAYVRANERR